MIKLLFVSFLVNRCPAAHSFSMHEDAPKRTRNLLQFEHQGGHRDPTKRTTNNRDHRRMQLNMMPLTIYSNPTTYIPTYCLVTLVTNFIYLSRRSVLRNMTKRRLLRIRLTREDGVSLRLYIANLITWQLFVTSIFPLLEPTSRLFGYVSFYYFYPNASGFGLVFEPLSAQSLKQSKRTKHQIRLDWHRFSVNVGPRGRDGYRHPPSVERNWPHVDIPKRGMKHWPWRRQIMESDMQ